MRSTRRFKKPRWDNIGLALFWLSSFAFSAYLLWPAVSYFLIALIAGLIASLLVLLVAACRRIDQMALACLVGWPILTYQFLTVAQTCLQMAPALVLAMGCAGYVIVLVWGVSSDDRCNRLQVFIKRWNLLTAPPMSQQALTAKPVKKGKAEVGNGAAVWLSPKRLLVLCTAFLALMNALAKFFPASVRKEDRGQEPVAVQQPPEKEGNKHRLSVDAPQSERQIQIPADQPLQLDLAGPADGVQIESWGHPFEDVAIKGSRTAIVNHGTLFPIGEFPVGVHLTDGTDEDFIIFSYLLADLRNDRDFVTQVFSGVSQDNQSIEWTRSRGLVMTATNSPATIASALTWASRINSDGTTSYQDGDMRLMFHFSKDAARTRFAVAFQGFTVTVLNGPRSSLSLEGEGGRHEGNLQRKAITLKSDLGSDSSISLVLRRRGPELIVMALDGEGAPIGTIGASASPLRENDKVDRLDVQLLTGKLELAGVSAYYSRGRPRPYDLEQTFQQFFTRFESVPSNEVANR